LLFIDIALTKANPLCALYSQLRWSVQEHYIALRAAAPREAVMLFMAIALIKANFPALAGVAGSVLPPVRAENLRGV
jgi:hypothetical protein